MTAPAPKPFRWDVQFPTFPAADMPPTPAGFVDTSWANEVCPSFIHEGLGLALFTDWADRNEREWPEADRYTLHRMEWAPASTLASGHPVPAGWVFGVQTQVIAASEDFDAILSAIAVFAFADALGVCIALTHLASWEAEDRAARRPCPDLLGWIAECRKALAAPGRTSLGEVEAFAVHLADLAAEAAA